MTNDMEKHTLLLEQCRNEMNELAVRGEDVLRDTVAQVEKQSRSCALEWKQAAKTVELITKQYNSVEEACHNGENKLAAAVREEDDAKVAMETLQRMMEDTKSISGGSATDTARILQKAGNVLSDTFLRAQDIYDEKKAEREEIDAAVQRLHATERAVQYTLAKAESNASRKMMVKVVAERRHEICQAQYENIRLQAQFDALGECKEAENTQFHNILERIEMLEQQMVESRKEADELQAAMDAVAAGQEARADEATAALRAEVNAQEQKKQQLVAELEQVQETYAQRKAAREQAQNDVARTEEEGNAAAAAAHAEEENLLQTLEEHLRQLQDVENVRRTAYENAAARVEAAEQEAQRRQEAAEAGLLNMRRAEEDENAAQQAADTAARLAENAVKVRDSIGAESSELLSHAQEVLMEAAASAGALREEKTVLRLRATQEYDDLQQAAQLAAQTVETENIQMEMARTEHVQSRQTLEEETQLAEQKKQECAAATADVLRNAEQALQQAKQAAEDCLTQETEAQGVVEHTLADLAQTEEALQKTLADAETVRQEVVAACTAESDAINAQLQEKQRTIEQQELQKTDLILSRNQHQDILQQMEKDYADLEGLLQAAHTKVDDMIAAGVLDIISAESVISDALYREEAARRAANEVAPEAQPEDAGMEQFVSLQQIAADALLAEEEETNEETARLLAVGDAVFDEAVYAEEEPAEEAVAEPVVEVAAEEELPAAEETPVEESAEAMAKEIAALKEQIRASEEDAQPAEETAEEAAVEMQEEETLPEEEAPVEEAPAEEPSAEEEVPVAETAPAEEESAEEPAASVVPPISFAEAKLAEEIAALKEQISASEVEEVAAEEPAEEAVAEPAVEVAAEESPEEEAPAETAPVQDFLNDLSGLTAEEIEYTQRLEILGNSLVKEQADAEQGLPVRSGAAYVDWMEQLARNLQDEEAAEESAAAENAAAEEQPAEDAPTAEEPAAEAVPEEKKEVKPKKRRFSFFRS